MMKKGINIWSFPPGASLRECFRLARQAGFAGVEPAMAKDGEITPDTGATALRRVRDMAEAEGLCLPSLATGLYWQYPLTDDDSRTRDKAREILRKQLEAAAVLGADTILVIPGAVGVDFIPDFPVVPYDVAYDRAFEAIREAARDAESAGVSIGIENVWNKFLLSPLEMRRFIDDIGSPAVGAYLDVGNVIATGYPEQWADILGSRIRKVHLKDYRRQVGSLAGFVDLLSGDVPYPAVMDALGRIGYDGFLIAEMLPPYRDYPEQILRNTSGAMDRLMQKREA